MLIDKKFRKARLWSNNELAKFSLLFNGKVVNVSGWRDEDKSGKKYKDYFVNASEYWITNFKSEARGYQGDLANELYLDLEQKIAEPLIDKFDVVFNHTVLEHIFEIEIAFHNLCKLSKDIVIITVPFLQEQHGAYGDFWRFTPLTVNRLFQKNKMELLYLNFNDEADSSIYIFAIATKQPAKWQKITTDKQNKLLHMNNIYLGTKIIKHSAIYKFFKKLGFASS